MKIWHEHVIKLEFGIEYKIGKQVIRPGQTLNERMEYYGQLYAYIGEWATDD